MRMQGAILLASCIAVLAGCGVLPTGNASRSPVSRQEVNNLVSLVDYTARLSAMPAAEQERERNALRLLQQRERTDVRTLQYALALSLPGGDARRAQALLEPLLASSGHDAGLRALAQVVAADLAERRRLEGNAQAQARRADELEAKLNALKEIETHMLRPDARPGAGP